MSWTPEQNLRLLEQKLREHQAEEVQIRQDILRIHRKIEEARRKPEPPEPRGGSVVRFTKQFSPDGKVYSYAAIRWALGMWRATDASDRAWAELVEFADEGSIEVATGWQNLSGFEHWRNRGLCDCDDCLEWRGEKEARGPR